jgi:hypothetical protein
MGDATSEGDKRQRLPHACNRETSDALLELSKVCRSPQSLPKIPAHLINYRIAGWRFRKITCTVANLFEKDFRWLQHFLKMFDKIVGLSGKGSFRFWNIYEKIWQGW